MDARNYTVALLADGLPASERIAAELRFIGALERALGAPETVAKTYTAWIAASESQADEIDKRTAELAVRWPQVYQAAAQAGLRGVHGVQEAHFELRLARGA